MAVRIACVVVLLIALGALIVQQQGCQQASVAKSGDADHLPRTEKEFRDKLAGLRMQKDKLQRGIQRLEIKKQETVDFLKENKVTSSSDVQGKPDLEYAVRNLEGWVDEINKLKGETGIYDKAIAAIETMLDEIERKRINDSVAITDADWVKMESIVIDLNEQLGMDSKDIFKDEEMNKLLQSELGNDPPETDK
jgi:hypothetical protein